MLTASTIANAYAYFVDNAYACIVEVLDGRVKVNDPENYIAMCELCALQHSLGKWDHTFTFRQYATFVQTGKCHALLP